MDNGKERFSSVPDEVRLYVRGGYGEIAGKIDPNLYDRITKGAPFVMRSYKFGSILPAISPYPPRTYKRTSSGTLENLSFPLSIATTFNTDCVMIY